MHSGGKRKKHKNNNNKQHTKHHHKTKNHKQKNTLNKNKHKPPTNTKTTKARTTQPSLRAPLLIGPTTKISFRCFLQGIIVKGFMSPSYAQSCPLEARHMIRDKRGNGALFAHNPQEWIPQLQQLSASSESQCLHQTSLQEDELGLIQLQSFRFTLSLPMKYWFHSSFSSCRHPD